MRSVVGHDVCLNRAFSCRPQSFSSGRRPVRPRRANSSRTPALASTKSAAPIAGRATDTLSDSSTKSLRPSSGARLRKIHPWRSKASSQRSADVVEVDVAFVSWDVVKRCCLSSARNRANANPRGIRKEVRAQKVTPDLPAADDARDIARSASARSARCEFCRPCILWAGEWSAALCALASAELDWRTAGS